MSKLPNREVFTLRPIEGCEAPPFSKHVLPFDLANDVVAKRLCRFGRSGAFEINPESTLLRFLTKADEEDGDGDDGSAGDDDSPPALTLPPYEELKDEAGNLDTFTTLIAKYAGGVEVPSFSRWSQAEEFYNSLANPN